jgi:hypothetical protein
MVDNLTFDDGEPITQNKLQSLYTAIKVLEGKSSASSIENKTDNTVSVPVIYCGRTTGVLLSKTFTTTNVQFNGFNFETDSVRIVLTPSRANSTGLNVGSIDYYTSNITRSGFTINVASIANGGLNKYVAFDYIATELRTTTK